jgi:hypothetical protein
MDVHTAAAAAMASLASLLPPPAAPSGIYSNSRLWLVLPLSMHVFSCISSYQYVSYSMYKILTTFKMFEFLYISYSETENGPYCFSY